MFIFESSIASVTPLKHKNLMNINLSAHKGFQLIVPSKTRPNPHINFLQSCMFTQTLQINSSFECQANQFRIKLWITNCLETVTAINLIVIYIDSLESNAMTLITMLVSCTVPILSGCSVCFITNRGKLCCIADYAPRQIVLTSDAPWPEITSRIFYFCPV